MRILLTLLRKDFTMLRRNRGALILSLIVPMVLIAIVGSVFGLNRKGGGGPSGIRLAVVNESDNPAAAKLVEALQAEPTFRVITTFENPDNSTRPLTVADLRPLIHDRKLQYALVIPANLVAEDRIGLNLETYSDPRNSIEKQMVDGMLQKTIFGNVPQLIGESLKIRARNLVGEQQLARFNRAVADNAANIFGGDSDEIFAEMQKGNFGLGELQSAKSPATTEKSASDFLSSLVKIKNEQVVGKQVKNPEATRVVGGYAVMFLLFALSGSSAAFFDEKRSGIFQRLLAAPVRPSHLLWSRFIYGILFGLIQLVALFIAGSLLYDIDVLSHLGNLLLVCAATAAACTAFGMLLAAWTRSQQAAASLGTLLVLVMSACGGAWFPVSFLPLSMQHLAPFTIVYWALDGFSQVMWAGNSLVQILPTLGVLSGIAIVVMGLAVWRFNRSKIFG
jgi:ABC-2 type transport system permease protein